MKETQTIILTNDEAIAFVKFQQYHEIIGYIVGHLDSIQVKDMRNSQVVLDIDNLGKIGHVAITKHFRQ